MPAIIEGIWETGEVLLLGGSRGCGKTALTAWLTQKVLTGQEFLGHPTTSPSAWATIVVDRDSSLQRFWWRRAGLGDGPGPCYCICDDLSPEDLLKQAQYESSRPEKLYELLCYAVSKVDPPPGSVLVIDVVNPFAGHTNLGYIEGFVRGWSLGHIARSRRIGILGVMHGGKQKRLDTYIRYTDRIIANTGFLGAVNTISYLTTLEESAARGYQEFEWDPHTEKAERFILDRTEDGLFKVIDAKTAKQIQEVSVAISDVEQVRWSVYLAWVPAEGADAFITTAEIVRRATAPPFGFSKRTVERDIGLLEESGLLIRHQGQRGRWQKRQVES